MSSNNKETIEVVPYSPLWPQQFQEESQKIKQALGDNCITVHHVGSTAIPGLWAKPILDMIPVVKDINLVDDCKAQMEQLGFDSKGEHGMLFRRFFQRKTPKPACNVHVYPQGSGELERLILFRNFLIKNQAYREKYAALKRQLSQKSQDITSYTLAKDALIKEIDEQTGFDGYRIVHALSDREWQAYFKLLQTIKSEQGRPFDKSHPIITNPLWHHLVLYKGAEVVGAACIEYNENHQGTIRGLAVDSDLPNQELAQVFEHDLREWLEHKK